MFDRVEANLDLLVERYPALLCARKDIEAAYERISACYTRGGKLIICGNGGSCADAEHIVGELMKGFNLLRPLDEDQRERLIAIDPQMGEELANRLQRGLPAVALSSHPALNTAFLNDVDGDMMYAQQLNVLGSPGDVMLGISTSGNAKNIRYAAVAAKAKGMEVVALTGKTGGELKGLADVSIIVPGSQTYQIQELHLPVYHCLCLMLEERFFVGE